MFYFYFDLVFNVNNILVNVDHFIKTKHYLQTLLLIKFTDTTYTFLQHTRSRCKYNESLRVTKI